MDQIEFEGRWKEPYSALYGELVWVEPEGKGGLQTHLATVNGKIVAKIRKVVNTQERVASAPGWVWSKPLAGSVAEKLGIGETHVKGFADLRIAKCAIEYAFKHLPSMAASS